MESYNDLIAAIKSKTPPGSKIVLIQKIHPAAPVDAVRKRLIIYQLKRTIIHYIAIYGAFNYLQQYYGVWKDGIHIYAIIMAEMKKASFLVRYCGVAFTAAAFTIDITCSVSCSKWNKCTYQSSPSLEAEMDCEKVYQTLNN